MTASSPPFHSLQHALEVLIFVVAFIVLSLVARESVKARVARRLGDPTAMEAGFGSLSPQVHVDAVGLGAFLVSWLVVQFPFGWARPAPVTRSRYRHPPRAMAIVALSGILVNLVLAVLVELVIIRGWFPTGSDVAGDVLLGWFQVSIGLSVFHLLPVPPLDGSRIVGGFLRRDQFNRWLELDPYGPIVLLVLFLLLRNDMLQIMQSASNSLQSAIAQVVG